MVQDRAVHFGGAANANHFADRRRLDRRRARNQRHLRAAASRFASKGKSHPSAGPVAQVAHRVEVFEGRSGGHDDTCAAKGTVRAQDGFGRGDNLVRLRQPSLANPPAGQVALARLDEAHAARRQRVQVAADRFVREHLRVHRRRDEHRRTRRGVEGGQEVVGDAVGELAENVCRCRRDEQQVDRRRERDVLDVGIGAGLELVGDDPPARDRLEGHRANEARRGRGHDSHDLVAALLQSARDLDRLIGADAAGDPQGNQH